MVSPLRCEGFVPSERLKAWDISPWGIAPRWYISGLQPNVTYFSVSVGIEIPDELRLPLNGASWGEWEFTFHGEKDICFGSSYRVWQPKFFTDASESTLLHSALRK